MKNDHLWDGWFGHSWLGKKSLNILVSSSHYGKTNKKKFVSNKLC
jgi:hypothetical protein